MERSITERCRSARCPEDRIRCFASAAGGEESGVRRCGCRRLHPTIRRWKGGPFERHERMCKEIWVGLGGTPVSDRVLAQACHPVFRIQIRCTWPTCAEMPAPTTFLFLRFVVPEPFPCFSSTCRNPRGSPPRLQMLRIGSFLSTPHPGGDISVDGVGGAIEGEGNRDESRGIFAERPTWGLQLDVVSTSGRSVVDVGAAVDGTMRWRCDRPRTACTGIGCKLPRKRDMLREAKPNLPSARSMLLCGKEQSDESVLEECPDPNCQVRSGRKDPMLRRTPSFGPCPFPWEVVAQRGTKNVHVQTQEPMEGSSFERSNEAILTVRTPSETNRHRWHGGSGRSGYMGRYRRGSTPTHQCRMHSSSSIQDGVPNEAFPTSDLRTPSGWASTHRPWRIASISRDIPRR